ncbi:MAG: 2-hydroxyacid dehydrogenase, partial [Rivularia sp. ALOHA_DT_140]|nr:2-hydroxyacid dehydrogenase [Rivularia sp. ALOHA_DT_140]
MKIAIFSTKKYDRQFLSEANADSGHEIVFFEPKLSSETTTLASGFSAVCAFINDQLDRNTLSAIANGGTKLLALRSAGFNNVDI